ncbi:hypothetical protein BOX15_Mlig012375g2 [Macrostomum lignano]|uniref:PH domain-containing protein n=1 Tax=Macrostomum lignano TaxID=282301 RepID=A0A267EH28_9PLAT|nr:hypothetical protein BOX15_Mlig012375g2 [Macrostomum lignano]
MSETGGPESSAQSDPLGQLNPDERLVIAALSQELHELAASYSDLLHNAPGAFLILTRRLRLLRSTIETRLEFIQLNPNHVRLNRLSFYRSSLLQLGSQVLSLSEAINRELQAVNSQKKLSEKTQETLLPGTHRLSKSLSRNSYSESDLNDPKRLLSASAGPKDTSNSSGTTNSDFRKSYSSPRSLDCYSSLSETYENFVLNNITVDTVRISYASSPSSSGSQITSTDGSVSGVTPSSNLDTSSPALASTSEDFERGPIGMQEFYISPNTTFYQMESPSASMTVPSADFGETKAFSTKPAPPKVRINRKQFLPASVDPQPYIDSSASNRSSRSYAAATLQQGSTQSGQTLYSLPAEPGSSASGVKRAPEESASEALYDCIGGTDDYEPILRNRIFGKPRAHPPYQLKHQLSEESGVRPVWDLSEGNLSSSFERTLLHTEPAVREHRKAMLKPGHLRKGMQQDRPPLGSVSKSGRDNLSEPNTPMQDKILVHSSAAPIKLQNSEERILLGASSNSDSSARNVRDSPDILASSKTKQISSRQAMIPGSLNSSIQVLSSIKGLLKQDLAKRVHEAIVFTSERKQEIKALTAALPIYSCVKGSARLVQLHPIDLQFDNSECESSEYDNAFQNDPNGRSVMSESAVSASSVSMDYYLPPDDTSATGDSANAAVLLAAGPLQNDPLPESKVIKNGFVNKLSGKFKVWKRFWCILTTQSLLFYPAKPGAKQKAQLCVSLEDIELVNRSSLHDYGIDLKVKGSEKSLYLSCDSTSERSLWYYAMIGAIKRHSSELIVQRNSGQLLLKGWLKRVKCGNSKKFYCRLYGHFLVYYKRHNDSVPTGNKDLSNSIIYEVSGGSSSESDGDYSEVNSHSRTLAIRAKGKEPVYFICSDESEFIRWRHLLTQIGSRIEPKVNAEPPSVPKTPTPKSSRKVMPRRQSWLSSPFSNHLALLISDEFYGNFCHSDQLIEAPVSKLPSDLSNSAILLFHLILLYVYPSTEANAMEKADLVKRLSLHCFDLPLLKDELYLQLLMQTIPSPKSKLTPKELKSKFKCTSPKLFCSAHSSTSTISASSQQPRIADSDLPAVIQSSWQLLSLIVPLFLPSDLVLSFAEYYLNEQLKSNNALVAKFAASVNLAFTRLVNLVVDLSRHRP